MTRQERNNIIFNAIESGMNSEQFKKLLKTLPKIYGIPLRKKLDRYFRIEKNIKDNNILNDYVESGIELNSLTLDTVDFLFREMGGVEINDGFIMEV